MILKTKNNSIHIRLFILIILSTIITSIFSFFVYESLLWAKDQVPFPSPLGYVSDFAGIISSGSIRHLEEMINYMKQKTGAEVAVVTLKTIAPYTIEEYAVRLYETWGIGQKDKDNGVLILLALEERKVRIEVGYGLEGAITDGKAGEIIRLLMIPSFKKGGFDSGLVAGTEEVLRLIAKEYNIGLPENLSSGAKQTHAKSRRPSFIKGLFSLLLLILFIIFLFKTGLWPLLFLFFLDGGGSSRGGWYGGGGGFGGGFGGFGGGMSGGGGASGSW